MSKGSAIGALMSVTRFGKFVSVGAIGAVCDTVILLILVERVGLLEEVAVLIGIESSILIMFFINDNWTYSSSDNIRTLPRRLLRSHTVRAIGATTQFIVFTIIYRSYFVQIDIGGVDLWLLAAKGTAIVLGMALNYIFETIFTWSIHKMAENNISVCRLQVSRRVRPFSRHCSYVLMMNTFILNINANSI